MCYYLITFTQGTCKHQWPTKRHYIDCNMTICTRSCRHNPATHECGKDCRDWSVPDQKICLDTVSEACFECRGLETPRMRNWDSDDDDYVSSSEEEESGSEEGE